MARDAELDRLKTAQDRAFQRKQDAYQALQRAWGRRTAVRETLNRAHEAKQRAYADQDASWQAYQQVRSYRGSRIDQLNASQEAAFENMKRAFDNAASAHDRRDGASARAYADEGHRYKVESQGYVHERRGLVDEIRSVKARHEATKPAFQRAKDEFSAAKRTFDLAKAEHERAQADFKHAKAEFDSAARAFKARLEKVKADAGARKNDKRSVAERAGVPYRYRDAVWVSTDSDGNTNIYFGGVGEPSGPGHGHYVMDRSGTMTYRREPFDQHGAQNFTEPLYWHKMKISFDTDSDTFQTDNYIGIVGDTSQKNKAHIAVDPEGEIVYVRDIGGEVLYDKKRGIGYLPDNLDWSK